MSFFKWVKKGYVQACWWVEKLSKAAAKNRHKQGSRQTLTMRLCRAGAQQSTALERSNSESVVSTLQDSWRKVRRSGKGNILRPHFVAVLESCGFSDSTFWKTIGNNGTARHLGGLLFLATSLLYQSYCLLSKSLKIDNWQYRGEHYFLR